jgi:hypothetical protein
VQLGYFLEIVDLPEPLPEICDAVVDAVAQSGPAALQTLFKSLARVDAATYSRIVPALLDAVRRRSASPEGFVSFIREHVRGTELKAIELARFGFREQAIAVAGSDRELVRKVRQYVPPRG